MDLDGSGTELELTLLKDQELEEFSLVPKKEFPS